MEKNFGNMDDKELDQLFKEASQRYIPPQAPSGAWDIFIETKLSIKKKQKKKWFRHLNILLPLFIIPRLSWPLFTCGILVLVAFWFVNKRSFRGGYHQANKTLVENDISEEHKFGTDLLGSNQYRVGGAVRNFVKSGNSPIHPYENEVRLKWPEALRHSIGNNLLDYETRLAGKKAMETAPALRLNRLPDGHFYLDTSNYHCYPYKSGYPGQGEFHSGNYVIMSLKRKMSERGDRDDRKEHSSVSTNVDFKARSLVASDYNELVANSKFSTRREDYGRKRWQFGVLGGSSLSFVKGTLSKKPGLNAGLMVQRGLNLSRLSVETGIILESMDYNVANSDFHPAGKEVSDAVSHIKGTCRMVDIPVNVRYDLVRSRRNSAFVSTGISAIWMAKQDYSYQYMGEKGVAQVSKDVTGQGKDLYATTNVCVGYERHFKRAAVQLAPYVNIPIGSVGYGNLSLGNLGAQILIKQSF